MTNPNLKYLREHVPIDPIVLLQGGTRSGKTYSASQYTIELCCDSKGLEIDIVRNIFADLRFSVMKDLFDILKREKMYKRNMHDKTNSQYELNGNLISFFGCDSDKLHGRERDILFLNEGQQVSFSSVQQLFSRTRHRVIVDFNPALGVDHWLDPYIDKYGVCITTYRDNPHLTAVQVAQIEQLMSQDKYYASVYGNGIRTAREGVIFENAEVGEFPSHLPYIYGCDFGFSTDPTTLVKVAVDDKLKRIYVDELVYEPRLNTNDIFDKFSKSIYKINDLIVADNAEPRLIFELKSKRLNVESCIKMQVRESISMIQPYTIVYTGRSHNVRKELANYAWNDRKSETPIDDYNHAIDAIRYAFHKLTGRKKQVYVGDKVRIF